MRERSIPGVVVWFVLCEYGEIKCSKNKNLGGKMSKHRRRKSDKICEKERIGYIMHRRRFLRF